MTKNCSVLRFTKNITVSETNSIREDGFGRLSGGHGNRQNMLALDAFDPNSAVR